MTPPVSIEPTIDRDYAAWLPLWLGYQRFYGVEIAEEVSRITWRRFHDGGEPMFAALARSGTEAVGFVHFVLHRSCWSEGDYCYLQDLFVAEGARNGGVGRRLIEHVYARAAAEHCARVYWLTQANNALAMRLYDRIADRPGFVQYRKAPPFLPENDDVW